MTLPTGEQFELETSTASGDLRATITAVAAGIRSLSINGIDLVPAYAEDQAPPMGAGIVLAPWPNRIRDGRWEHEGVERQLAITEPARNNAIHGLLRYTEYKPIARERDSVTLSATIYPQLGYPFLLGTAVHYELVADGLRVTHYVREPRHRGRAGGHRHAPVPEDRRRADGRPHAPARRGQPHRGRRPAAARPARCPSTAPSGTSARGAGSATVDLDDAFGEISAADGQVLHTLTAPDGRSVSIWADDEFDYVQVFTTPRVPRTKTATWPSRSSP